MAEEIKGEDSTSALVATATGQVPLKTAPSSPFEANLRQLYAHINVD